MSQEILSQITKSNTDHSEETNAFKQAALDNNNASMQSINGLGDLLNNQNSNIAKSTSAVGQYNTLAQQDIELQQQTNSLLSQILAATRQLMFSGDPRGARLSGSGIGALALGGAAAFLGDGDDSGYSPPGSPRYDPPTSHTPGVTPPTTGSPKYDPPASYTPGVTSSTGVGDSGMARVLAAQRANRGANKLSLEQKRHLYALAIAEMGGPEYMKTIGDSTVIQGYAAFMETAYNRGMTEGRSNENVSVNLRANYYKPLRAGEGRHYDSAFKKLGDTNSDLYKLLDNAHDLVAKGSDYSNLATQNSSAHVAASAERNQTITSKRFGDTLSRKDRIEYSNIHGAGTVKNTIEWVRRTREQAKKFDEQNRSNTKTIQTNAPPKPRNSSSFKLQPLSRNELRAKGGSWGKKPGDRTIFMDFNGFSDSSAKGFEIIIPNDATHAEIAAAVKFRDNWVALASKYGMTTTVRSGGKGMPAGIKTTRQNKRGRAGAFHTESFFGSHKESAQMMANPDFQKDYAVILSEFAKDMPGSTLQTPHDIKSQGTDMRWNGERISEYGFSKKILVPLLKQIQEEDARARGLSTPTTTSPSGIIPSTPLIKWGVGANIRGYDPDVEAKRKAYATGIVSFRGFDEYTDYKFDAFQSGGGRGKSKSAPSGTYLLSEQATGGVVSDYYARGGIRRSGAFKKVFNVGKPGAITSTGYDPAERRGRTQIQIHSNIRSDLDKLRSSGCITVPPEEYAKLIYNMEQAQKALSGTGEKLTLVIENDGSGRALYRVMPSSKVNNRKSISPEEAVKNFKETGNISGKTGEAEIPELTIPAVESGLIAPTKDSGFILGGEFENVASGEQILLDIDKELPDETPDNGAVLGLHETVNLATNNIKNAGQILASATAPNIVLPGKTSTKPAFSPEEPATMVG